MAKSAAHHTRMAAVGKNSAKKRILVVDEFPMLRYGLITFLNAQPDMVVCGEANSIPNALIKISECKPHLLVIGLRLGTGDTVEFIKALKVQNPALLILVYSAFEESIFAMRALRARAAWATPPGRAPLRS